MDPYEPLAKLLPPTVSGSDGWTQADGMIRSPTGGLCNGDIDEAPDGDSRRLMTGAAPSVMPMTRLDRVPGWKGWIILIIHFHPGHWDFQDEIDFPYISLYCPYICLVFTSFCYIFLGFFILVTRSSPKEVAERLARLNPTCLPESTGSLPNIFRACPEPNPMNRLRKHRKMNKNKLIYFLNIL